MHDATKTPADIMAPPSTAVSCAPSRPSSSGPRGMPLICAQMMMGIRVRARVRG